VIRPLTVQLDLHSGARETAVDDLLVVRRSLGAPVLVLLARLVAAAEPVTLEAHHRNDLRVGEFATDVRAPCRHGARRTPLTADVATGAVRLAGVRLVAGVDEAELIGDVVERLLDLTTAQLVADTALAAGAVAGSAFALEDRLPEPDGSLERDLRRFHRL